METARADGKAAKTPPETGAVPVDAATACEAEAGILGRLAQAARLRIAELESERDTLIAQANQKVVAYNAVIGEKQKDLEMLGAMAAGDRQPLTRSEEEARKQ